MKQIVIKLSLCFFAIILPAASIQAQQFKWVTGGGTTYDFSSLPSQQSEQTYYMCTDPNGNIYALSQVGNNPIYADTFYRASGAYGADQNVLLTSYTCNGVMRWAKLIASSSGICVATGIVADNLGHLYVAGCFEPLGGTLHIGYDASFSGTPYEYQSQTLIQFDTLGHYDWLQFVGNNAMSTLTGVGYVGSVLTLDAANNVHFFNDMESGVHITPTVTSIGGTYDLVYNTAGTLLSEVRLDLDSEWNLNGAVIDPVTNKLYVSGQINQSIYGGFLTDTFYAAAFDASRNLLWQYFCGHGDDDAITGIVMDQSKHLYFSGNAQPISGSPTFSFHGDSVSAPFDDISIVMKTDTNGHVNWIKHYDSHTSVNYFGSITLLPNSEVAAGGTFASTVTDGTITLSTPAGFGYSPYIVVLDSAGDQQTIQQIFGDGFYNAGSVITSDKVGNIYVGGEVADSIFAGSPALPAYHTVGGNTDFFVMKYGVDCSCTSAPVASYTVTGVHTINATYTGTTTGLDSLVWNFGDGSTGTGSTATHTYSDTGIFRLCVTVYTSCGSDIFCSNVLYDPSLVSNVPSMPNVKVYPNPANDELNVTGITETTQYRLLNVTGICIEQGILQPGNNTISMQKTTPGIYILEMTSENGERNIVRVVKE